KDGEQIVISNLCRIVFDLGNLGVAGSSSAYLRVGWVWRRAARIARRHGNYALQSFEHRFSAPEAAPTKDCNFCSLIHGLKNNSMLRNVNERRHLPGARFLVPSAVRSFVYCGRNRSASSDKAPRRVLRNPQKIEMTWLSL